MPLIPVPARPHRPRRLSPVKVVSFVIGNTQARVILHGALLVSAKLESMERVKDRYALLKELSHHPCCCKTALVHE